MSKLLFQPNWFHSGPLSGRQQIAGQIPKEALRTCFPLDVADALHLAPTGGCCYVPPPLPALNRQHIVPTTPLVSFHLHEWREAKAASFEEVQGWDGRWGKGGGEMEADSRTKTLEDSIFLERLKISTNWKWRWRGGESPLTLWRKRAKGISFSFLTER